jgi:hypothetical protein
MKTVKTHFSEEFKLKAKLFKQVFLLQIELEKYMEGLPSYHHELKEHLDSIERLLQLLMDSTGNDEIFEMR